MKTQQAKALKEQSKKKVALEKTLSLAKPTKAMVDHSVAIFLICRERLCRLLTPLKSKERP